MRKEGLAKGKQQKVLDATSRDKWFSEWSEDSSGPLGQFQEPQEIKKYFYNTPFAQLTHSLMGLSRSYVVCDTVNRLNAGQI